MLVRVYICQNVKLLEISCRGSILIVIAAVLWGDKWCKKRIFVNCDNEATVEIILNKGRSKLPFIMKFVRKLVWFEERHNFVVRAKHIYSAKKSIADAISRSQILTARRVMPSRPVNCLSRLQSSTLF